MIQALKKIKNPLEKMILDLEEVIEQRESLFDSRTEKWQESEKGETYDLETSKAREVRDELQEAYDLITSD